MSSQRHVPLAKESLWRQAVSSQRHVPLAKESLWRQTVSGHRLFPLADPSAAFYDDACEVPV